jgi:hypothetical protein
MAESLLRSDPLNLEIRTVSSRFITALLVRCHCSETISCNDGANYHRDYPNESPLTEFPEVNEALCMPLYPLYRVVEQDCGESSVLPNDAIRSSSLIAPASLRGSQNAILGVFCPGG